MRLSIAGIFVVFLAFVSFAQSGATVVGTVRQDDRPEPEAVVGLRSKSDSKREFLTTADKDGNFRFENVPPGEYTITSAGKANSGRPIGVIAKDEIRLIDGEVRQVDL